MARKKIKMEKKSHPEVVIEDLSLLNLVPYSDEHFISAVYDLSLELNNPYFKTPFVRCPNCNEGNNSVVVEFGVGAPNKIGNLKGFQATIGDIISWNSRTYKGLSIIKTKENGVFGLATAHFKNRRKESAVVERMIIPQKYRPIIGEMATYLANMDAVVYSKSRLLKIGEGKYPYAIKKKL